MAQADISDIQEQIKSRGEIVRKLKADKADKDKVKTFLSFNKFVNRPFFLRYTNFLLLVLLFFSFKICVNYSLRPFLSLPELLMTRLFSALHVAADIGTYYGNRSFNVTFDSPPV